MNTQHENAIYRRGVVLGLTMAEVVILIIFCLLLLLANIVEKKNDEIKCLKTEIQQQKEQLGILEENPNLVSNVQKLYRVLETDSFDDLFKELILLQKNVSSIKAELKKLQEKTAKMQEFEGLLQKHEISADEMAKIIKSVQNLKTMSPDLLPNYDAINDLPNKIELLKAEITTKHNRMAYLQKKLGRVGKGTEKPACWATPDGKSEYIFDMSLTSDGIVIHDNKLQHRSVEQRQLPLSTMDFSKELTGRSFRASTQELYEWSNQNECRFFVKVFDRTKQNEKSIYKKRLRIVGEHFYYFEPTNEDPSWLSE